ncbi:hypothetical protein HZS_5692 [Henneguya salminicola]|nr:hypothetical protein HZS_5692 [Henneguya salminicola]
MDFNYSYRIIPPFSNRGYSGPPSILQINYTPHFFKAQLSSLYGYVQCTLYIIIKSSPSFSTNPCFQEFTLHCVFLCRVTKRLVLLYRNT